jgi:hypothetical protein
VEEPNAYLWSSPEGAVEEARTTQTKTEARRNAGIFPKVIPSLGLCSPPHPLFEGGRKERKFDSIWVWNAKTQHLMHKVRGNCGSCTWGVVKMHPTAVEASGKGEDGVKPRWNSVEHRKWCVLEFDPQLKANVFFWRFFFDLTRFLTKLKGTGAVFSWLHEKLY